MRHPFCRIHAMQNEFGLWAYRCPSEECFRRRVVASGGWLNVQWNGPEVAYVFIPIEGVLDDEDEGKLVPGQRRALLNSIPSCPWCGARMRALR